MLPSVYELPLEESEMDLPESVFAGPYQQFVDWVQAPENDPLSTSYYVNRDGTISTSTIMPYPATTTTAGLHWDYSTTTDWGTLSLYDNNYSLLATSTVGPAAWRGQTVSGVWVDEMSNAATTGRDFSVECQVNALPVAITPSTGYITSTGV